MRASIANDGQTVMITTRKASDEVALVMSRQGPSVRFPAGSATKARLIVALINARELPQDVIDGLLKLDAYANPATPVPLDFAQSRAEGVEPFQAASSFFTDTERRALNLIRQRHRSGAATLDTAIDAVRKYVEVSHVWATGYLTGNINI